MVTGSPCTRASGGVRIGDGTASERDEGGRQAQHEPISTAGDDRLVEHDAGGRGRALRERSIAHHDACAELAEAEMPPHTRARADVCVDVAEQSDVGAQYTTGAPCILLHEDSAPLHF